MNLSIIVVTWNSEEYIEECLSALNKSNFPSSLYEIIIVDNASKDNTLEIIRKKFPQTRVIKNPSNLGLSYATNQGNKIARGKYILLLNPDVIVMESTIMRLYQFMEENKNVGACGARFFWPNGKIQYSCRAFPTFKNLFLEFSGISKIIRCPSWKMKYFDHKETREVDQPMGSCLIIRKKVFDEIGGMDERYPIYMNDVDLCYRIKDLGYKIFFLSKANVIHYVGGSICKVRRKMILTEHWSVYRYLKTHFKNQFLLRLYGFFLLMSAFYRSLFRFTKSQLGKRK